MKKYKYLLFITTLTLCSGKSALAIEEISIQPSQKNSIDDLVGVITSLGDKILAVGGALAVLLLIVAGVRYIISAGNPTQIEGAKKTLTYVFIGIAVVALATTMLRIIMSLF